MMGGIGLGVQLAQLQKQGPSEECKRCGLSFLKKQHEQCPHCADLDDNQLKTLLERVERESRGNAALGLKFLLVAFILIVFIVLINL